MRFEEHSNGNFSPEKRPVFYVSAIYVSPPNTMGGNTKIVIEFVNELSKDYPVVLFTTEPLTFRNRLSSYENVSLIEVPYPYHKKNIFSHFQELYFMYGFLKDYFRKFDIKEDDFFYSASDFGPDVVPVFLLRIRRRFKWIASLYLFIPNPMDNLKRRYGFPFFKYFLYFFYQKGMFALIRKYFWRCCITNDVDKIHFPLDRRRDVFAVYGGVNTDQIEQARKLPSTMQYSAVFCGRLHPQKGISQLLNIWAEVCRTLPQVRLAVIGNGDPIFEAFLKRKAENLLLTKSLDWLGYVNDVGKYNIYLKSRLFIHPTIYDNNGMVAAEALCAGLPVVMYDLESLRSVYSEGTVKVPYNDKNLFAQTLIKLLSDESFYRSCCPTKDVVERLNKKWQWKNRTELFRNFLKQERPSVAA